MTAVLALLLLSPSASARPDARHVTLLGRVGTVEVRMEATREAAHLGGYYHYASRGIPLAFDGAVEVGGAAWAEERPPDAEDTTGRFVGIWTETPVVAFRGTWHPAAGGRAVAFDLRETWIQRTAWFDPIVTSETRMLDVPVPAGDMRPAAEYLHAALDPTFPRGTPGPVRLRGIVREFFGIDDAPRERAEFFEEFEGQKGDWNEQTPSYSATRASTLRAAVISNHDDVLSLEAFTYSYAGGAHGMYGSGYLNLDLARGETIAFARICPGDTRPLAAFLTRAFRAKYGDDISWTPEIAPTENFYLAPGGVGFVYPPYEIGPYAIGQVNLFVRWSDLPETLRNPYVR